MGHLGRAAERGSTRELAVMKEQVLNTCGSQVLSS